jgi:hypothetical protein
LKKDRKLILRLSSTKVIAALLVGVLILPATVEAKDVNVLVESRKGIGLIPRFWRGVVYDGGKIPELGVDWVRIDPSLVVTAWREKIGGGGPGWVALDAAISKAKETGARVLVSIPTSAAPKNEVTWGARVEDTVSRTHTRVDRFEILADPLAEEERYLQLYEVGVWAAYRGYHKVQAGGPGTDWRTGLVLQLIQRAKIRVLPLNFVSWAVTAESGEEAEESYSAVEVALDRAGLKDRPSAVVSSWQMDDSPNPSSITLSFLHSLTKANLDAAFADLPKLPWGLTAMKTYDRLGQVEIPMLFESEEGLHGVATLEGDDVRMLLWADKTARAKISVSGMRWGRTYDYSRSVVGLKRTQVVESRDLRAEDPVEITVSVNAGSPVFLTLTPQN